MFWNKIFFAQAAEDKIKRRRTLPFPAFYFYLYRTFLQWVENSEKHSTKIGLDKICCVVFVIDMGYFRLHTNSFLFHSGWEILWTKMMIGYVHCVGCPVLSKERLLMYYVPWVRGLIEMGTLLIWRGA